MKNYLLKLLPPLLLICCCIISTVTVKQLQIEAVSVKETHQRTVIIDAGHPELV